jgi:uncharacterized protein YdeI (YjbR/CyaY-like superfamily)
MVDEILIEIYDKKDFRKWLSKNHNKEKKVGLILHKKHTGKSSPSHRELMEEAICFGWIDTTIKKLDDERYMRYFCRRTKNSTWSYNTLSYAKQLIKEKRMNPSGLIFYKEGLKKKPLDHGIPKNPDIPEELKRELEKKINKKIKEKFEKVSPSMKKTYFRWILHAKLPETKKKRIDSIIEFLNKESKKGPWSKDI